MHELIYTDQDGISRSVKLGEFLTIGRNPNQSVQILDLVVSKSHATIERCEEGFYLLSDNQSRNGTFVNSIRVNEPVRLNNGDKIQIGATFFYFSNGKLPPDCRAGKDRTVRFDRVDSLTEETKRGAVLNQQSEMLREDNFLPVGQIAHEKDLRRDYDRLRVAFELTRSICLEGNSENRGLILNQVLDAIMENTEADRVLILLNSKIDEDTGPTLKEERETHHTYRLYSSMANIFQEQRGVSGGTQRFSVVAYRVRRGKSSALEQGLPNISQTIFNRVMAEKRYVLSTNVLEDERFSSSDSIVCSGVGATMTVPLLSHGEVLGMIHLDSHKVLGVFDETDLAIILSLARQVTLLFERILLQRKMEQEILWRKSLSRLLSPKVVDKVISGDLNLETKSKSCHVTVMFVDIRGFTQMSESLAPEELVEQLNEYFSVMTKVVFEFDGMVDKVIGDEIMAVWGVPLPNDDGEFKAVCCALRMLEALNYLNTLRQRKSLPPIEVGIGINSGMVIAGYMGAQQSVDYTVAGDTVNVAARICEKAREERILVGSSTWEKVKDRVQGRLIADNKIRGRSEQVEIYSITPAISPFISLHR